MYIEEYISYLAEDKKKSHNTQLSYQKNILSFEKFIISRGLENLLNATQTDVIAYLMHLKNSNKSRATISHKLSTIKSYYNYLLRNDYISVNPAEDIKPPKVDNKELKYLSVEEVEKILEIPNDSVSDKRDKAMMEVMYATGVKVTELVDLKVQDVNLDIGFVTCNGEHGLARIVPLGSIARKALDDYLSNSRPIFCENRKDSPYLFLNRFGDRITRQSVWNILKKYGERAGVKETVTPHIFRNSFAVHLAQNGADIATLQELLGHEDILTTQFFMNMRKKKIKEVYDNTFPRA